MQNSLSVMNLPQSRGTNYELYASEPEVPTPVIETYFSISHSIHIITSEAHKKNIALLLRTRNTNINIYLNSFLYSSTDPKLVFWAGILSRGKNCNKSCSSVMGRAEVSINLKAVELASGTCDYTIQQYCCVSGI
jgi:hypothetical protein